MPARGAHRAPHADRAQAPLDLGPGRSGEHHAGGGERDQRQRHQQVDYDSRRLVEQHTHSRAGDEAQPLQAVARRARLNQDLVEVGRVAQPDLGQIYLGVGLGPEPRGDRRRRHVDARDRERIGDVVGALGEADDPLRAEAVDVERAAELQPPRVGQALLDDHLPEAIRQVAPRDDRVAVRPGAHHLDVAVAGELIVGLEGDAGHLLAQRVARDVGQRGDALRDAARALRVEADDDVRQIRGLSGAIEAEAETVGDHQRRHQHRRGERDPQPGQERAPAPGPHSVECVSDRCPQANSLRLTSAAVSGCRRPSCR